MGARLTLGCGWVVWGVVVLALGLSGRHPRPANNLKRLPPLLARGTDGKAPLSRGDQLDQTLAHLLDLRRREIIEGDLQLLLVEQGVDERSGVADKEVKEFLRLQSAGIGLPFDARLLFVLDL